MKNSHRMNNNNRIIIKQVRKSRINKKKMGRIKKKEMGKINRMRRNNMDNSNKTINFNKISLENAQ